MPVPSRDGGPYGIASGPDGALWFTMNQANAIGRIDTDGTVTMHPLPTQAAAPWGSPPAPTSRLVVGIAAGQIGRITPDGTIDEFALPDRAGRPHAITTSGSGDLWFTEWAGSRVGSVTTDGTIEVHDLPTPRSEPHGITLGPDGAPWAALENGILARINTAGRRRGWGRAGRPTERPRAVTGG
ncbi:hypothetical protein [Micromonospora sp. S-DT3-3-22]|uniref:Vgb family protein n=1 Tax=Micromonospora sp. S-DT3-3-22 TaxID=2755359 RepID=UPI00188DF7C7|nr:hypothetical protein [Micromonospora sp. S-DT3-3-22]